MRKRYWDMFFDLKVSEFYFQLYSCRAAKWGTAISALVTLGSAACVLNWYNSSPLSPLLGILIVSAQIFTALQNFLPFGKRGIAANYIYREVAHLFLAVEAEWDAFNNETSNEELARCLAARQAEYLNIADRYASPHLFPWSAKLHEKAQEAALLHFRRYES